jgi:hypothetical protein
MADLYQISSLTFFTILVVFPADLNPLKAVWEVGSSGGGAWLTAAAMPGAHEM